MATVEQCAAALGTLSAQLAAEQASGRQRPVLDRTVQCTLLDLQASFHGRLRDGHLVEVSPGALPGAQITLQLSSDDLLAVTAGTLNFAAGWATGRIKVDASVLDLFRLRSLL